MDYFQENNAGSEGANKVPQEVQKDGIKYHGGCRNADAVEALPEINPSLFLIEEGTTEEGEGKDDHDAANDRREKSWLRFAKTSKGKGERLRKEEDTKNEEECAT